MRRPSCTASSTTRPCSTALAEQVARSSRAPTRRARRSTIGRAALSQAPFLAEVFARVAPGAFERGRARARQRLVPRSAHDELTACARAASRDADVAARPGGRRAPAARLAAARRPDPRLRDGRPLRLRHVAVDEVQDFSPLEVRVLLDCLDEHRSLTLAGDTQQHVLQEAGFTSWGDFFRHLGLAGTEVEHAARELSLDARDRRASRRPCSAICARTTRRRMTTRAAARRSSCFASPTTAPLSRSSPRRSSRLAADEPLASVAVLTPSRGAERAVLRAACASARGAARRAGAGSGASLRARHRGHRGRAGEGSRVRLRRPGRGQRAPTIPDTPHARRLLHVGATRAIHQLWLTSVATPSAPLRNALDRAG